MVTDERGHGCIPGSEDGALAVFNNRIFVTVVLLAFAPFLDSGSWPVFVAFRGAVGDRLHIAVVGIVVIW